MKKILLITLMFLCSLIILGQSTPQEVPNFLRLEDITMSRLDTTKSRLYLIPLNSSLEFPQVTVLYGIELFVMEKRQARIAANDMAQFNIMDSMLVAYAKKDSLNTIDINLRDKQIKAQETQLKNKDVIINKERAKQEVDNQLIQAYRKNDNAQTVLNNAMAKQLRTVKIEKNLYKIGFVGVSASLIFILVKDKVN